MQRLNTPGLPEIFTPVNIIERGAHHAAAGRGMNELIIGVINADMKAAFTGTCFKKDQIAGQELVFINFSADFRLHTRFTRKL
jgi:hypothetical protein